MRQECCNGNHFVKNKKMKIFLKIDILSSIIIMSVEKCLLYPVMDGINALLLNIAPPNSQPDLSSRGTRRECCIQLDSSTYYQLKAMTTTKQETMVDIKFIDVRGNHLSTFHRYKPSNFGSVVTNFPSEILCNRILPSDVENIILTITSYFEDVLVSNMKNEIIHQDIENFVFKCNFNATQKITLLVNSSFPEELFKRCLDDNEIYNINVVKTENIALYIHQYCFGVNPKKSSSPFNTKIRFPSSSLLYAYSDKHICSDRNGVLEINGTDPGPYQVIAYYKDNEEEDENKKLLIVDDIKYAITSVVDLERSQLLKFDFLCKTIYSVLKTSKFLNWYDDNKSFWDEVVPKDGRVSIPPSITNGNIILSSFRHGFDNISDVMKFNRIYMVDEPMYSPGLRMQHHDLFPKKVFPNGVMLEKTFSMAM